MVVTPVEVNFKVKVLGAEQLKQLAAEMGGVLNKKQQMAALKKHIIATNQRTLKQLQEEVVLKRLQIRGATKYTNEILREQVRLDALNASHKQDLTMRREKIMLQMQEGKGLRNKAEQQGFAILMQEEMNRKNMEATAILRLKQRQILASTMAIFGMTMSIWQMTNALSSMAGDNEEAREEIAKLQGVLMGATGPVLFMHGVLQMMNMEMTRTTLIARMAVPALMGVAMAYMAMTAPTKELKALYSVMTGITMALTAAQIILAKAHWATASAKAAEAAAEATRLGIATAGASLTWTSAAIVAGVGVGATLMTFIGSTMAQAQTQPGQIRRMKRDAPINAHQDEIVGRPEEVFGSKDGKGTTVIVNIDGQKVAKSSALEAQRERYMGWH